MSGILKYENKEIFTNKKAWQSNDYQAFFGMDGT